MSDEKDAETHEFWATAIYDAGLLPRPVSASPVDNTKSADPLPWVNGHGVRKPDDGTSFGLRNDMARWSCSLCIRHYAPRPEFGFTEGKRQ